MDKLYRGDGRARKAIEDDGGFHAWVPLTVEQARDMIRLYTGIKQLDQCNFKNLVTSRQIALENNALTGVKRTPLDLKELIIRSRNKGPSISTDISPACGGYANGYVYTLDASDLAEVAWMTAVPGMKLRPNAMWPSLWLDGPTLDGADSIAIRNKGFTQELSFLTSIPADKILDAKKV